jgi:hypothetical protein
LKTKLEFIKRKREEAPVQLQKKRWNKLDLRVNRIPGPWPDSKFKIHNASLKRGENLANGLKSAWGGAQEHRFVGLDTDQTNNEELCIFKGTGGQYNEIIREAGRIIRKTPIIKEGFSFTSLGFAKGISGIHTIIREKSIGMKALWVWAPRGSSGMKVGGSKFFGCHSKLITWVGTAPCSLRSSSEDICGVIFYNWRPGIEEDTDTCQRLEELGFMPRTVAPSNDELNEKFDVDSTTTEEEFPHEEDEMDPTAKLPEVHVADAWKGSGPPPRGCGWWGRGAPIQVLHGYRTEDLVDGAGLCSPGRWHPSKRILPDTGDLAKDLVGSMKLDMEAWEKLMIKMLAGQLQENPFTEALLDKLVQRKGSCSFQAGWRPRSRPGAPPTPSLLEVLRGSRRGSIGFVLQRR